MRSLCLEDEIDLQIGMGLVKTTVDPLKRFGALRRSFAEKGLCLHLVRLRSSPEISPHSFVLHADRYLAARGD